MPQYQVSAGKRVAQWLGAIGVRPMHGIKLPVPSSLQQQQQQQQQQQLEHLWWQA